MHKNRSNRRSVVALSAVILGVTATAVAYAQQRPDFSGVWTSVPETAATGDGGARPRATLGSGWGPKFAVTQHGDSMTVERAFFSRGEIQPVMKFRYSLDESETRDTVMMGRGMQEQVSTTAWAGDTLVITTVHSFRNPENGRTMTNEVKRRLSLRPERLPAWPPLLVIETFRSGVLGGPSSTTRTVYRRN